MKIKINRGIHLCLLSLFLFALTVNASYATTQHAENDWPPLYHLVNPNLQSQLEYLVNSNARLKELVINKKLAIGIVDLNGKEPRFARVNGNKMMYAASLPKIAILLAAYESFEDGSLKEDREVHEDLAAMIRHSSNDAATRMIDRIGMRKINAVLKNSKYEFYDAKHGGGLWVGKRYAKKGTRHPDPLNGISHGASVTQICRFYYLLSEKRLVSPSRSEQMLQNLSDPALNHKFVYSLDRLAPDAKLYRKSGTWRKWHSDSILVQGNRWRNYILTAMVESSDGEAILKSIVLLAEKAIKAKDIPRISHKDKQNNLSKQL